MAELCRALAVGAYGVVLLNRRGEAGFLDAKAADLLRAADGLSISGGRLIAKRPPEMRKLTRYIRDVVTGRAMPDGGRRFLLVTRPSGKRPYLISLLPPCRGAAAEGTDGCACVAHLHDLDYQREPACPALRQAFGLTAREADLAIGLVRTARLDGAAAAAGMAVNTARNHLRGIFLKTGTSKQSETVQLLSKVP